MMYAHAHKNVQEASSFAIFLGRGAPRVQDGNAPLTTHRDRSSAMADPTLCERILVYKITNLVNGKAYLGITARTCDERWEEHVYSALNSKSTRTILRAIKKYGPENFLIEEVCVAFGRGAACEIERFLIIQHGTLHPGGYNLTNGGEGSVGRRVSERTKLNMSNAAKALWADPECRARMVAGMQNRVLPASHIDHLRRLAAGMKGKPRRRESVEKGRAKLIGHGATEAHRQKMRDKWADPAYRERVSAAMRGKKRCPEGCRNISAGKRGKKMSAEGCAAVARGHTGLRHSEETRQRMRDTWARKRRERLMREENE